MTSPRPLRVLQLVLSLNPGGTERLVVEMAKRLNVDVPMRVCCLDDAGAWTPELQTVGITVDALMRPTGFTPRLGATVAALARRHRATVIHAHHYSPFVYAALARCLRPGLRVIFTEHGRVSDAPPSPKRRLANRLVFSRLPTRVFAVSENLKEHVVQEGFAPGQVDVIYNGIDAGLRPDGAARARVRERLAVGPDVALIGAIARLDPVKDLATLLRAAALVGRARAMAVLIVGDGPERPVLEALASTLGITAQVTFLGHRDDARSWLAGCDVFVNSSVSEGVSLTILEAMAAGLPVVATAVGGTPEVVTAACGLLVPPRDPAALARAVLELAADATQAARMGDAARERVERRFTIERMIQQYLDAYRGRR